MPRGQQFTVTGITAMPGYDSLAVEPGIPSEWALSSLEVKKGSVLVGHVLTVRMVQARAGYDAGGGRPVNVPVVDYIKRPDGKNVHRYAQ